DDLVPERARRTRAAVVAGGLARKVDAPRRTRARRIEEVAVSSNLVRPGQARPRALVELPPRVVGEKRRLVTAPRQPALLEPEHEPDLEPPRARAQEIEHGHAAGLRGGRTPNLGTLERRDELLRRQRALELTPTSQLAEQPHDGVVRADVLPGDLADRRRL